MAVIKSRRLFVYAGLAVLFMVIAGSLLAAKFHAPTPYSDARTETMTATQVVTTYGISEESPSSSIAKQVASMSLEEKVGQMMMIGFEGKSINISLKNMIANDHIGNVILFGPNIDSDQQVAALDASLQQLAVADKLPAQLMIATDQEGGKIRRLADIGPQYSEPVIGSMGIVSGTAYQHQSALEAARQLKQLGINADLAPVADVSSGDKSIMIDRSFGNDPRLVSELTGTTVRSFNQEKLISCVKHFPGLGSVVTDPEEELPTIASDNSTIDSQDLPPFTEAIKDGAPMVMVTHVSVPALDPSMTPASLSRPIITDLLRNQLGFQGVIITDDLEMGAISIEPGEAAVSAIAAGADMVMFAHTPQKQQQAYDAIVAAVKSGRLSEEIINAAVMRILQMKQSFGLDQL
ncbi:MAG: glycoside hydrolase family 3 protein [Thermoleophilia bacterium]